MDKKEARLSEEWVFDKLQWVIRELPGTFARSYWPTQGEAREWAEAKGYTVAEVQPYIW